MRGEKRKEIAMTKPETQRELFEAWGHLGRQIESLASFMQNDPAEFPLTKEQKREWWAAAKARQAELAALIEETVAAMKNRG